MPQKVLVTGGAGFIGAALIDELLDRGDDVVVFDSLHPQVHDGVGRPTRLDERAQLVIGDVAIQSNWQALFKLFRPDTLVHLAAETGTGQSLLEASRHASVNVLGTSQMLDALAAAQHVPQKFLLASSRAVYGDGAWRDDAGTVFYPTGRHHEDLMDAKWNFVGPTGLAAKPEAHDASITRPNPISVYGATKLAQEHMLSAWCRAFGAQLTILRLQNVYGVGQAPKNAYTGILTLFARLARERQQLDIYEDGDILRDFVHVSDVVQAMIRSISRKDARDFLLLDLGSGKPVTIAAVAHKMARMFDAPEPVVTGKFRDGDVRSASCNIQAAQKALGYEPRVDLDAGLATLVQPW